MTPAARTEAAIGLIDAVLQAAREGGAAADAVARRFFAARRYAGSKDRRAIREIAYRAIRRFGEPPPSGRAAVLTLAEEDEALRGTFDGSQYGPSSILPDEARARPGHAPDWLIPHLDAAGLDDAELRGLLERAPVDLRVNALIADRDEALASVGGSALHDLPDAIRLPPDSAIENDPLYAGGGFEVQDAGSQIVAMAAGVRPGGTAIDLCAGAGGKTLALAAIMRNQGRIVAADTDRARLSRLRPRAVRAGVGIAETRLIDPGREVEGLADLDGSADWVLIDAPCSGTGTWRRNPEARWRLTPARLDRLVATQARLLDIASALAGPAGTLTYVVCSLLDVEGRDQVDAFLKRRPDWQTLPLALPRGSVHGSGMRLTPASHGTDGFFVARLARR